MRRVQAGAAVEGEKINVQTRKWTAFPPKRTESGIRHSFKLGMDSEAAILEPYQEPAKSVAYTTSMTSLGDEILGAVISGWSKKTLGPPNVSKASGAHSGSFVSMKGGCYAHVEQSARMHLDDPKFNAKNPPIQEVLRLPTSL